MTDSSRQTYNIFCNLTRYCNFNCAYCWPYAHTSEPMFHPKDVILGRLDRLKVSARQQGFTVFNIALNGGEPTQHPACLDIVRHIAEDTRHCARQSLHLTTNLSRGTIWWLDFILAAQALSVTVSASWHHAMHQPDMALRRANFADKIALLTINGVKTLVTIVIVAESWATIYEDARYFRDLAVPITLQPVITEQGQIADSYTDTMLALIKAWNEVEAAP